MEPEPKSEQPRPRRFVGRRRTAAGASAGAASGAASSTKTDANANGKSELARRARASGARARALMLRQVPESISKDPELLRALEQLPANYDFQVAKTVWRLKQAGARKVALQLPEGLLIFACVLADIFEQCAGVEEVLVMADVTYGACCIDDFSARALGCDFMVHYGHSCLVPIDVTGGPEGEVSPTKKKLQVMYVFVDIAIDVAHLVECVKLTFPDRAGTRLALLCTIQFAAAMHEAKALLDAHFSLPSVVPQAKPLSKGEVLGCTSPSLAGEAATALVFVADGRFHMESAMIANPELPAFRYNPYDKALTEEAYDSPKMHGMRRAAIAKALPARRWGVVLGTLGRQGSPAILRRVEAALAAAGKEFVVMLLSEMFPAKLALLETTVQAWVQIACPRLSIDWGEAFSKPLLSPYEAFVALGKTQWREVYPQDFYARDSGPWTNYYKEGKEKEKEKKKAAALVR